MRATGYVDDRDGDRQRLSAKSQRAAISAACLRYGWELTAVVREEKGRAHRPRLAALLRSQAQETSRVDVVLVTALKLIARSIDEYTELVKLADRQGWHLVTLDTPMSAEVGHRIRGERVKAGQSAARARGVALGRKIEVSPEAEARIVALYKAGSSLANISEILEDEGFSAPLGGRRWWPSGINNVIRRSGKVKLRAPGRPSQQSRA